MKKQQNNETEAGAIPAVPPPAFCSASDEVRRMVFAFDDYDRQDEVRRIAARVKALEDALLGMREYYRQHMITPALYKQVEAALGMPGNLPNDQGEAQHPTKRL